MEDEYLTRKQAAAFLTQLGFPCRVTTLETWACVSSKGPRFYRKGHRVVYLKADLIDWVQTRTSGPYASTSTRA